MESLNIFDWIIVAIVGVSAIYGLIRGFVRELMALVAWVAAYFIARMFAYQLSHILASWIDTELLRLSLAFVLLFIATLVVSGLLINLMTNLVSISGLTATDHIFGIAFGVLRGALIVMVIVSLLSLSPVSRDTWWQSSILIPHFVMVDDWTHKVTDTLSNVLGMIEPAINAAEQTAEAISTE